MQCYAMLCNVEVVQCHVRQCCGTLSSVYILTYIYICVCVYIYIYVCTFIIYMHICTPVFPPSPSQVARFRVQGLPPHYPYNNLPKVLPTQIC